MKVNRYGKRAIQSLAVVATSLFVSGCWGQQELDSMSIVLGVGLDMVTDETIQVTTQVVNPGALQTRGGSTGGQTGPTVLHVTTGRTVEDAFLKLYDTVYRSPYYGHNNIVLFSEAYARRGVQDGIDYFERHPEFRKTQLLLVTASPIEDVFGPVQGVERLSSRALEELVRHRTHASRILDSSELNFVNQVLSASSTPVMPIVSVRGVAIQTTGLALFQGTKMVNTLPLSDARGLMWILGTSKGTDVTLSCPHSPVGNAVHILDTQTAVSPVQTKRGLVYVVKVRGSAEVRRMCAKDKLTPQLLRTFGEQTSNVVRSEMNQTMATLQRDHIDAVQFGSRLFEVNPTLWRKLSQKWESTFSSVDVRYDVRINILRTGLISSGIMADHNPAQLPPSFHPQGAEG